MSERAQKPLPQPSAESAPYWEATKKHRLVLQHCRDCGQFWFPPSARCRHCFSGDFFWDEVSGKGRIFSFVVYYRLYHPGFDGELPYVVAIVELEEGPRLLTNVVGTDWQNIRCDSPVRVIFEDDPRGAAIPKFEPAVSPLP